jgi:hypothetical protein
VADPGGEMPLVCSKLPRSTKTPVTVIRPPVGVRGAEKPTQASAPEGVVPKIMSAAGVPKNGVVAGGVLGPTCVYTPSRVGLKSPATVMDTSDSWFVAASKTNVPDVVPPRSMLNW